jgi:hypothetical protein
MLLLLLLLLGCEQSVGHCIAMAAEGTEPTQRVDNGACVSFSMYHCWTFTTHAAHVQM